MRQRGFTLVELIIASTVAVVISGLLLVIMVNSTGLFYEQSTKVSQGVNVNDALSSVRQTARSAISVSSQYPEVGTAEHVSSQTAVIFKVSSIDQEGNIIPSAEDYIIYYLSNERLIEVVLPNVQSSRKNKSRVLSNTVEILIFEYLNSSDDPVVPDTADKVKITLGLKQLTSGNNHTHIATSEANLRND